MTHFLLPYLWPTLTHQTFGSLGSFSVTDISNIQYLDNSFIEPLACLNPPKSPNFCSTSSYDLTFTLLWPRPFTWPLPYLDLFLWLDLWLPSTTSCHLTFDLLWPFSGHLTFGLLLCQIRGSCRLPCSILSNSLTTTEADGSATVKPILK